MPYVNNNAGLCYCTTSDCLEPHQPHYVQSGPNAGLWYREDPAVYVTDDLSKPTEVFTDGGQRESNAGRPRPDLLWTADQPLEEQMLQRDAVWYAMGAAKYGERNWERFGPDVLQRCKASLARHYHAFMAGDRSEDHAAAIRANVQMIEYIEWKGRQNDGTDEGPF